MNVLQDSGERREFESGAVRDTAMGKGRCDLLPLDVAADLFPNGDVLRMIQVCAKSGRKEYLFAALTQFAAEREWDAETILLETAKHMENGIAKYPERNWEKGIPAHCYVDSGVRHYLKWRRGDTDEPHDRAFCWNILCLIWTMDHRPECNDLTVGDEK